VLAVPTRNSTKLNEFLTQQLRKRARKSVWETPHLLLATLPKRSGHSAQKDEATQHSEEYVQTGVVPAVAVALILRLTAPALIADLVVVRCHAAGRSCRSRRRRPAGLPGTCGPRCLSQGDTPDPALREDQRPGRAPSRSCTASAQRRARHCSTRRALLPPARGVCCCCCCCRRQCGWHRCSRSLAATVRPVTSCRGVLRA
jgi:hypothetical protein